MQWVKMRYLDASALVKLVIDEGNHQEVRTFFQTNTNFCATSMCLMEALGVIKGKWKANRISDDIYFFATKELILEAWSQKIQVDSIDLFQPENHSTVESLARSHALDLSDALQLQTILKGTYSRLGPNSSSILITADGGLAKAAEAEGIRVWNCIKSPLPEWA